MASRSLPSTLNTYTYSLLIFSTYTYAAPLSLSSHRLSVRSNPGNNVGAAIGPLIGAVVLLFGIYMGYQTWRKRKDNEYFRKKEGVPRTSSKENVSPIDKRLGQANKGEKQSAKSPSSEKTGKEEPSGGLMITVSDAEVELKKEEDRLGMSAPASPTRTHRSSAKQPIQIHDESLPYIPGAGSRKSSITVSEAGSDSSSGRRETPRLSQGAQRTVQVSIPEPVRTKQAKVAGVRGSEYWSQNTRTSRIDLDA